MTLYNLVFNPYEVNAYVVSAADGQCVLVDPACCTLQERETLKKFIADKGLRPVWLINTHGHYDHIAGNAFVCETWSSVKPAAHRDDLFIMEHGYHRGEMFGFPAEKPPTPDVFFEDGDTVEFGDASLKVIHVPGHSPGSIVLYSPEGNFVITGDVLFNGSIGRTDLPGGNHALLIDGIKNKLMTLPPDTIAYPGHGTATSIGKEKATNPFLNK